MCLHAKLHPTNSKIVVQVCDEMNKHQRFKSDEQGRLVPKAAPEKCIFKSTKGLNLRDCGDSVKKNTFLFNIFENRQKVRISEFAEIQKKKKNLLV